MRLEVKNEDVFTVPGKNHFGVGGTSSYTLAYSSDGVKWTNWSEATPANENLIVSNCPANFLWKLVGHSGTVWVTY